MVKDNRLGGVDNICVLRRRTARNAVTRPTTVKVADQKISMAQTGDMALLHHNASFYNFCFIIKSYHCLILS